MKLVRLSKNSNLNRIVKVFKFNRFSGLLGELSVLTDPLKIVTKTIDGVLEQLFPWQSGYRQDLSSSADSETLTIDWSLGGDWVVQINHNNVTVQHTNWTPRPRTNSGTVVFIGLADVTGFSEIGNIESPGNAALTFKSGKSAVVEYYSIEDEDVIQQYQLTDDIYTILGSEEWDNTPDLIQTGWTDNLDGTFSCNGTNGVLIGDTPPESFDIGDISHIEYEVLDYNSGFVASKIGGTDGVFNSGLGVFHEVIEGTQSGTRHRFSSSSFNGTIGNISIKRRK